jgi:hypothetical protein
MSAISRDDVAHLAMLARIDLNDAELDIFWVRSRRLRSQLLLQSCMASAMSAEPR